ncbi:MAG: hypothetical protein HY235_20850 [Acidobacteria bacterium]|nr:hypothetical protein [Acidobacteriota bacterium]
MPRSSNLEQSHRRPDERKGRAHLLDGAERVRRAVHKQAGCPQRGKVRRAEIVRFARRMQRIGEQQKAIGDRGIFRGKHRSLTPAVAVSTEDDALRAQRTHAAGSLA